MTNNQSPYMQNATIWLKQILTTDAVELEAISYLGTILLAHKLRAQAFGITSENVDQVLGERSQLLRKVYPAFSNLCQSLRLQPDKLLTTLWDVWLPLAIQLASSRRQLHRPLIQGILGGQGTGKTTMGAILTLILENLGYQTLSLSLDDLYKTYSDRLTLTQQDPRLIWRGPPGTHDIELGLTVLDQLRQPDNQTIAVPRFDKFAYHGAGDRTSPEIVTNIDIVLFEGWFVGTRPVDPAVFDTAPPPIETASDREFARNMNTHLHDYLPLWKRLDRLLVLHPTDYCCSLDWRKQAEHDMIAAGKSGMSDAQIEEFVKYFWRSLHPELFIQPITKPPTKADLVIEIKRDHTIGKIYQPNILEVIRNGLRFATQSEFWGSSVS